MAQPLLTSARLVLRRILKGVAFLAALVIFIALLLTGTEAGTALLVNTVLKQVAGGPELRITVTGLEGTLFSGLFAREVNVTAGETRVSAGNLSVAWNPLALAGSRLEIRELATTRLLVRLAPSGEAPAANPEEQLAALFNLPLAVRIDGVSVAGIEVSGATSLALESVAGSASLEAGQGVLAMTVRQTAQNEVDANLVLAAPDWTLNGNLDWRAMLTDRSAAGRLTVGGSLERLTLEHTLTAPITVASSGSLVPGLFDGASPAFDLVNDIPEFDGGSLGLAGVESAGGRLTVAGTPADFSLDGDAAVNVAGLGELAITVATQVTGQALTIGTLAVDSDRFTLRGNGSADLAPDLAVNLDWSLANFSDGDLLPQVDLENLSGDGSVAVNTVDGENVAAFTIRQLTGRLNGYDLAGDGDVTLVDGSARDIALNFTSGGNVLRLDGSLIPAMDLDWTLQAGALDRLLPNLAGVVSGQGKLTGTPQAPGVDGTLSAQGLEYDDGENSYRIASLAGDASYNGGENRIDLRFTGLQAVTPAWQLRQDNGEISLGGTPADHSFSLQTRDSMPAVSVAGEGSWGDDGWQGTLASAAIDSDYGDWALQEPATLEVAAANAGIGNQCWQMDGLTLCGEATWAPAQGLAGNLQLDNLPLAWINGNVPAQAGGLERLRASLAERPVGIGRELDRYALHMPAGSLVEGQLDLTMDFDGIGLEQDQMTLSAELSPRDLSLGLLRTVTTEDGAEDGLQVERYGLDDVTLNVSRADSRWHLDSGLSIYVAEAGGLDFQGDFQGSFELGDDESLGGNFDLTFNNIAWLEALAPTLRNVSGSLGAGGRVGGNLQRPLLEVDASLEDGSVELPEYGLALTDVGMTFHSEGENDMTISGKARSGDGEINLSSRLTTPFLPERQMQLDIVGLDFLAYNRPEVRALVNPDLHLNYRDNVLAINGGIDVPSLQVDLSESQDLVGSGGVDVSRDAIVVTAADGSTPREAAASERIGRIPVTMQVRLAMGDDVRFQGFGLDAKLTGSLMLEQTVDRPLLALGELSIPTGSYGLYGQQLTISDGKLLFLGNPMNPALDVQATRQTPKAEVGILMNGTISHINAQLFSTPTLPESEILSLLITGNSFSSLSDGNAQDSQNMLGAIALLGLEKGQGLTSSVSSKLGLDTVAISSGSDYRDSALGLGKYINPNLFMRYDIGLFDRENVLTLDYLLTDRLKLEVESGISQSVDLTYTVEK